MPDLRRASPYLLAGLLAGAGTTHLLAPDFFDRMIPEALPGSERFWTYASGVAEIAVAAGIAVKGTRRTSGLAAAALLVMVFPANVSMALRAEGTTEQILTYARLPLQVPLIWWAWAISRAGRR